jgi:molybdopterin converting factor small subunit
MALRILFFGVLQDCTGTHALLDEPAADVEALRHRLETRFPCLAGQSFRFAVNAELAAGAAALNDGDEVALLPPFAGG